MQILSETLLTSWHLHRVRRDEDAINLSLSQKDRCTVASFPLNIWAISTSAVGLHLYYIPKVIRMRLRPSKTPLGSRLPFSLFLSISYFWPFAAHWRTTDDIRQYRWINAMGKTGLTVHINMNELASASLAGRTRENSPAGVRNGRRVFYFSRHAVDELTWMKVSDKYNSLSN